MRFPPRAARADVPEAVLVTGGELAGRQGPSPIPRRSTYAKTLAEGSGHHSGELRTIPRYAPFRDNESELLKLSVDLEDSPIRVLFRGTPDQPADLIRDLRPALATTPSPAPVQPKTGAMPGDDGARFHNDEYVPPASPGVARSGPEQSVKGVQWRSGSFPLRDGDLLSERADFQGGVAAAADERLDGGQDREDQLRP